MTEKTPLQKLAQETGKHFEQKARDNGDEFYCLRGSAPQWVHDMVRESHAGMLPDDYKYSFIVEALDALAETDDPDDITPEADSYNADLLAWLASHLERRGYVDEAVREFGVDQKSFDVVNVIGLGQFVEKSEVLGIVRAALENQLVEVA